MTASEELNAIADRMDNLETSEVFKAAKDSLTALENSASDAAQAFSGSWLGYHAYVYRSDLEPHPNGAHFSQDWGLMDRGFASSGNSGSWCEFDPRELESALRSRAGNPDLSAVRAAAANAEAEFRQAISDIHSILTIENPGGSDSFLTKVRADLEQIHPMSADDFVRAWQPKGQVMTRDTTALGQGIRVPPHVRVKAEVYMIWHAFTICNDAGKICRNAASHLERKSRQQLRRAQTGTNVFIGHGRSLLWHELKAFVQDRLLLPWDEFNRVPVAGMTNQVRLAEMLDAAAVALVIMTSEDETAEGQMRARMNVIHEVGLFQGRLGFTKAIILLEDGCEDFSNIQGLGQIRFPAGKISACFEEIRRVLEREGILSANPHP